jgi:hypothetical protein
MDDKDAGFNRALKLTDRSSLALRCWESRILMENLFFEKPILNSPYEYPSRHWELDKDGQPTQKIIERRRLVELITPIPKPKKRRMDAPEQQQFVFDEGKGISTQAQRYDPTPIINELRIQVDQWRKLPNPNDWRVTPETARLLQHWRHHRFGNIRPFFCQVEAAETAIWLTEVAPQIGNTGKGFLEHLVNANNDANTVTHVLGVRAFGTQPLCEQVIGRGLRRQSHDLNEENLFNVEYADVLGIPFDFTAKPVVAPPQPPRETIRVHAVRPERDALEIRFPRVEGYRVELAGERLSATFNDDIVTDRSGTSTYPISSSWWTTAAKIGCIWWRRSKAFAEKTPKKVM